MRMRAINNLHIIQINNNKNVRILEGEKSMNTYKFTGMKFFLVF